MAKSALQQFAESMQAAHAQQPSLGAEVKAMAREATKDIRGAIHQVFFGRPEGPSEPGTPLNPTPQIVTGQLTGRPLDMDLGR
jgi:hypothetical protein